MQSTKTIFKKLGHLLQAPLIFSRLPSSLAVQYNSYRGPQTIFYGKSISPFSTTAQIFEEKEHARSESKLFAEEFNLITRSPKFNKTIVVHTIEKYLKHSEKSNEIQDLLASIEFKDFASYIINNIDAFKSTEEIANITLFLISTSRNNKKVMDPLTSFIKTYPQLFSIPHTLLKQILERLFVRNYEKHREFLDKLLAELKNKRTSIDINEYVSLLDTFNKLLNIGQENFGKQSEEFENIFKSERDFLIQQLPKIKTPGLVSIYEFIFEEEPNEKWANLIKTIEERIVEDPKPLNPEQITKLAYILYWLQRDSHELWTVLEIETLKKSDRFSSNNLVSVVGCFSSLQKGSDDFYMQIDRQLGFMSNFVQVDELAPMVFCFAQSGKYRKKFFYLFSERIVDNIDKFSPSDLVRILWAYTVTVTLNESLYRAIQKSLIPVLSELDDRELGLLLDSLIAINEPHDSYLPFIVSRLEQAFGNSKNYPTIEEELVLRTYTMRIKGLNEFDHLLPFVDKYILYKLQDQAGPQNVDFILSLGNIIGENLDHFQTNKQLIATFIKKLETLQQKSEEYLDEEQAENAHFLLVNLGSAVENVN